MKRVLITGGSGFLGRSTLLPLLKRDYEIHIVTTRKFHHPEKNIIIHHANLLESTSHIPLIEKIRPTHLLHAAWYAENGKFWDAIENVYWLASTISLIDAFYAKGGERLLGIGTCAEYDWSDGLCIEGKTQEIPSSLYGKVKKSTYECLHALNESYKKSFAWARIFFPYGAYEAEKRLVPYVITNLLRGQEAACTHGNQIRDFIHVDDIGEGLAEMLDSKVDGPINMGSGKAVTIREIVNCVALALKKEHLIKFGSISEPLYSPKKIVADVTRLHSEVGWSAKLSLDEGIARTIRWWQEIDLKNEKVI